MRILLSAIFASLPLTVWAGTVEIPVPNPLPPPIIGDMESVEPSDVTERDIAYPEPFGNPYGPDSATNFEAFRPHSFYGSSRQRTTSPEPDWLDHPFGRYGNPYSPDPMNHRYDDGRTHSLGSLIDFPNRDVWTIGR